MSNWIDYCCTDDFDIKIYGCRWVKRCPQDNGKFLYATGLLPELSDTVTVADQQAILDQVEANGTTDCTLSLLQLKETAPNIQGL